MFEHVRAFHQPRTISEAIRLLNHRDGVACLVAGGTDLALRAGRTVTDLVDVTHLGLAYIKRDGRAIRIGATTTMSAIEQSSFIQHMANGILAHAAASCGSAQTRNLATLGGNLANASPAADTATPLLVLDADVVLQGLRAKRRLPLTEFFTGPHKTAANASLLVELVIPGPEPRTAWSFQKFGRTEVDISIVNVAAGIKLDRANRVTFARIALGAVAPRPIRAHGAEFLLEGRVLDQHLLDAVSEEAAQEIDPIDDVRASAAYRRELTQVLVRRALLECAARLERAL